MTICRHNNPADHCLDCALDALPDYTGINGYLKPEPLTGDDVRPDVVALDPLAARAHNPPCTADVPRGVVPEQTWSGIAWDWGNCEALDGTDCDD